MKLSATPENTPVGTRPNPFGSHHITVSRHGKGENKRKKEEKQKEKQTDIGERHKPPTNEKSNIGNPQNNQKTIKQSCLIISPGNQVVGAIIIPDSRGVPEQ
jgi:hypothetical protein